MIDYKGPKKLKEYILDTYRKVNKGFKGNPKINVGLEHLKIDYKSLGFKNEDEYFSAVDALIDKIKDVYEMESKLFDERISGMKKSDYKTFEEYKENVLNKKGPEEARLSQEYDKMIKQLSRIGDGHTIKVERELSKSLDEMTVENLKDLEDQVKGGYMYANDTIYFDPMYAFTSAVLDMDDFGKTLIHECTHREVGDMEINKDSIKEYERGKRIKNELEEFIKTDTYKKMESLSEGERKELEKAYDSDEKKFNELALLYGFSEKEIYLMEKMESKTEEYDSVYNKIKELYEKKDKLKIRALDEGLAFAAAEQEPYFDSGGYQSKWMDEKDYKKAFNHFKNMIKKHGYRKSVDFAKKVMNISYREDKDVFEVMKELEKKK